jgi:hypothetical protein
MKELDFYKRAASDAAFRREKLADFRYYKQVGAGLLWFCFTLGVGASVYGGLAEKKWDLGVGLIGVGVLCASHHALCAARVAALQALDEERK